MLILHDEAKGYRVVYDPGFLSKLEADDLLAWMLGSAPWQEERVTMYGKTHTVRRQSCAFGDRGLVYKYAGVTRTAGPWSDALQTVRERIGQGFNFALCNLYPDGQAKLGAHADNEPEIVKDSTIVGVSLGTARDFVLTGPGVKEVVRLEHGSAVYMEGTTQRHLKHAIPARTCVTGPRVSLTFRRLIGTSV